MPELDGILNLWEINITLRNNCIKILLTALAGYNRGCSYCLMIQVCIISQIFSLIAYNLLKKIFFYFLAHWTGTWGVIIKRLYFVCGPGTNFDCE